MKSPLNPPLTPSPDRPSLTRRRALAMLAVSSVVAASGCVNFGAMMTKMIFGDPHIDAAFRRQTGVKLNEKTTVIVYCTSPTSVLDNHPSLSQDLQKRIAQRMELRKIKVINPNDVSRAVDAKGGQPSPQLMARLYPEADYVMHIGIAAFDCREPNSPNLFRGYAGGLIRGYALHGDKAAGARHPIEVFQHEFQIDYPTHPVPRDSTSPSTFEKQFLERLSSDLGRVFYDFRTSEIL